MNENDLAQSKGPLRKVRATYHLPPDVVAEARDCVLFLSGPPLHLTLSQLVETALRTEIARLKTEHRGGEDFPREERAVLRGRPLSS